MRMAMRRYLGLSAIGVCLVMVLASSATAFAGSGSSTYYVGKNSQGQKLLFSVDQTSSGPKFDPVFTTIITRCPVTGTKISNGFFFQGFQIPIKNGKFKLTMNDLTDRFTWSGTVTPKKASGTEFYSFPAYDGPGGLQNCASGSVSWTAKGLVAAPAKAPATRSNYLIRVTRAADGAVHYSITR
jgi:hypothetical protein